MRCCLLFSLLMLTTVVMATTVNAATDYSETHQHILGTELSLTLVGLSHTEAQDVSKKIVQDISRLDALFSNYRDDSEISRLNAQQLKSLSPELQQVLQLCESWRVKTEAAFSCRIGNLLASWRNATALGEVPERIALRKDARRADTAELNEHFSSSDVQWQIDGLAKGYILDQALHKARTLAPQASGIKIDIGGDAVYWGSNAQGAPWQVAVAEPQHSPDNANFYGVLSLQSRAVAYSGHSRRYLEINHRRFSHIINPVDGWPVSNAPAAIVVASDAATADALATALTVMPINDGLTLVKRLPDVEALIMTETGKTFASDGWYSLLIPDEAHRPLWENDMQFLVEYEIPSLTVAEYRRPYVAVWITDADKKVVRQLLVHGKSLRWLREIPLWWRRYGRRDESMIDGLARPTPAPGQHMLVWDGRDDQGRKVDKGHYVLHLEIAREHGERELLHVPFELSGQAFAQQVHGEKEVGAVKVSFKP